MTEKEEGIKRRDYVKAVGAGVAGLAVGAAGGWYAGAKSYEEAYKAAVKDLEAAGYAKPPPTKELRFWGCTWDQPYHQDVLDLYNLIHPEIKFVGTDWLAYVGMQDRLLVALKGVDPPDIVPTTPTWMQDYAAQGLLDDLTAKMSELGLDRFYEKDLNVCKAIDGKFYGVPYRSDATAVFYNKEIFKARGVEEKLYWTWDEFEDICQKLTYDGHYAMTQGLNDTSRAKQFPSLYMWANDGGYLTKDHTKINLKSQASREGWEYYCKLYLDYGAFPPSCFTDIDIDQRTLFVAETVAMCPESLYGPGIFAGLGFDLSKLGVMYVPWPSKYFGDPPKTPPTTPNTPFVGGWAMSIPKNSKGENKAAAWEVIKFFLRDDMNVWYQRCLPPLKSTEAHYRYLRAQWDPYFVTAKLYGMDEDLFIPKFLEVMSAAKTALHSALLEQKTPSQALDDLATEVSTITGLPIA